MSHHHHYVTHHESLEPLFDFLLAEVGVVFEVSDVFFVEFLGVLLTHDDDDGCCCC